MTETLAGLSFSEETLGKFARFINELMMKNQELNVVSRKLTVEQIILEHLYDCVSGFSYFDKEEIQMITDLGSGGGFPGLLLAIAFPNKRVNMVEKSPKKVEYLNYMIKTLGLANASVHNMLVNEYKHSSDVITCRAFKPTDEIVSMTRDYFKSGGKYILFKARVETINEEISRIKSPIKTDVVVIAEKIIGKERHLLFLEHTR